MLQLLNVLVDICLLRRGPQHLPVSPALAIGVAVVYGTVVGFAERMFGEPDQAGTWAVASLSLLAGTLYLILSVRGVPERFFQTLTAIAGCGILYLAVYLPVALAIDLAPGEAPGPFSGLLALMWILLFFWGFIIEGGIYRHALGTSLPGGVLVSVLLYAAAATLYRLLFAGGT